MESLQLITLNSLQLRNYITMLIHCIKITSPIKVSLFCKQSYFKPNIIITYGYKVEVRKEVLL